MNAPLPRTITFDPTAHQALLHAAEGALVEARTLVIDSDAMYDEAGELLAQVKGSCQRIEAAKEALLKPTRELDKIIRAIFDPAIKARQAVEGEVKAKMIAYHDQKQREAEAARRAAEDAARKERERLEREAAAARARAEQEAAAARRAAEEAEVTRRKAEEEGNGRAAAAAAAAAAKAREQADQKQAAGERQAAELSERAQLVSTQPVEVAAAPKASGTSIRTKWKARVKNKATLLAFIGQNPHLQHLVDVDESALNKLAGAMGKNIETVVPGVEAYQEQNMASRAA